VAGQPPPWTEDEILAAYRFTNAFRAADRVSQYLIRDVIYSGDQTPREVFFRTILFKLFNRIETWQALVADLGEPGSNAWSVPEVSRALDERLRQGHRLYSSAYIMPCAAENPRGSVKHRGHVQLLARMLDDSVFVAFFSAESLERATAILRAYRGLGPFLSFQFAIDLNYSSSATFDEMEHVIPGPGSRDGLRKCFESFGDFSEADVIRWTTERQADEFERCGVAPVTLWGRPLQLIDVQNLFCELDKYARAKHPDVAGHSGRKRIKRRFRPGAGLPVPWFPPKWRLCVDAALNLAPKRGVAPTP
jgi:hypothetical protein